MDDDKKWLYDKFSKQGLNIGSYEDFENSLNNEEDRKWYHSKAQGMGLNVGDYDSFSGLFGPQQPQQPAQPQPQQQEPAPAVPSVPPVPSQERNGTEQQVEQPTAPSVPDSINGHKIPQVHAPNLERMAQERQQKEQPEAERGEAFQQDEDAAVTRIDELYKAKEKELRDSGQLRVHQNVADPYGIPTYDMPEDVDYDAAVLKQAKRMYADAEKTRKAAEGGRGFGKGIADSFTVANWDMGISDFQKNAALLTAAQKMQDGEELTEAEDLLLDAAAHKMASDMYYGNFLGRGYKAGLTTGQSLPFMLEFMINPVSGSAEGGGSIIGKALAKKIGDKIAKEGLAKTAATAAGRVAGDLASAAVMTGTTGALSTTADAFGRKVGDIKFRETEDGIKFDGVDGGDNTFFGAFAKAYGARTIENFSEMFGEYFKPIGKAVGGKARALNTRIGLGKVNDFIDNIGTAEWMETVNHFLNKTHWNGVLGEFGEEIVGGVMNALTVGDQSLGEVFSKDNLIDTFLGVGAFGGFVSAIKTVGYRTPKQQMEDKRKRLYNEGSKAFMSQDDWTQATTEIDAASEDELRQYISDFNATGYYTPEQAQAILQYAFAREERIGAEKAQVKKETEEPQLAEYDAIYEAAVTETDPEVKRAAKVRFDQAAQALADLGLSTDGLTDADIKLLNEDPAYRDLVASRVPGSEQAVDEYCRAWAALTGVNDSINAQVSDDIERAYNDIMSKSTDDGIYYDITLKDGTKVGLKSGVLAKAEDGSVDRRASSDRLYITLPDGTVKMISPREVREFTMAPAADLYEMAQQQIRQSYQQQLADEINTPTKQEIADSLTGEEEPFNVGGQTILGLAKNVTPDGNVIVQFNDDVQLGDRIGKVHPVPISEFVKMRQGTVAPTQAVEEQPQQAAEQPVQGEEASVQPEAEQQPQPAQSTTERDFRGRPMPVREDGRVDQKTLFQNDPEAWIEWNNRQMNDGGQDSRNYIEGSISREEKKIADLQKKYDKADDFDERDDLRRQIKESRNRIAALQQAQESSDARQLIRESRDIDPQSVDEVVSQYIKAYKGNLDKADFQRETGYSDADFKGFVGGFVTDNPQAIGVNRLAEIIKESDDTGLTAGLNDMDLRDAIINFMQGVSTWGDVNNYIANNRASQQAEQERAALQQAEDERQRQEDNAGVPVEELLDEERQRQQDEIERMTAEQAESMNQPLVSEKQQEISEEEAKVDTEPTEAQKEAGNYRKGHIKLDGYNISIEQPKGSVRSGTDAQGNPWSVTMNNTYGYIRGTEGVDGDHIDLFLSDDPEHGNIFVVDQLKPDGSFDEHKVMYGFPDMQAAREAYLSNYSEGWTGLGAITEVSRDEFRKWVESSHRKTKPFSEYKTVKPEGDVLVEQQPLRDKVRDIIEQADGNPELADRLTDAEMQRFSELYDAWQAESERADEVYREKYKASVSPNKKVSAPAKKAIKDATDAAEKAGAPLVEYYQEVAGKYGLLEQNSGEIAQNGAEIAQESPEIAQSGESAGPQEVNIESLVGALRNDGTAKLSDHVEKKQPYGQIHKKAEQLAAALHTNIAVHDGMDTVKNADAAKALLAGEPITGWYEEGADEVHIYAPNINSLKEAEQKVFHELVGHKGMRDLLGEEAYGELCDQVWGIMDERERAARTFEVAHLEADKQKRAAADEYIARLAERVEYKDNPSLWDKIASMFREALRKLGAKLELTDRDLADILRESYASLRSEVPTGRENAYGYVTNRHGVIVNPITISIGVGLNNMKLAQVANGDWIVAVSWSTSTSGAGSPLDPAHAQKYKTRTEAIKAGLAKLEKAYEERKDSDNSSELGKFIKKIKTETLPQAMKEDGIQEETASEAPAAEAKQGAGATIEPATYTTKRGKKLNMFLVKPARELSKDEKATASGIAKEGRGWYSREDGGFMMRDKESAQRLADALGSSESLNDERPLTVEDMRSIEDAQVIEVQPEKKEESEPTFKYTLTTSRGGWSRLERYSVLADGQEIYDGNFDVAASSPEELKGMLENNGMYDALSDSDKARLERSIERWQFDQRKEKEGFNGFRIGETVLYTPSTGKRKTQTATIHDFEFPDGRPVLDSGLAPVLYELVDWDSVKKVGQEQEPAKEERSVNPSGNKLVTDEQYADLRRRMMEKLKGQMNIGIDPEILSIGVQMAVYHIEKGARKFVQFAKAMVEDLGDAIRPYLKAFYNGARELPEIEQAGYAADMDSYDDVRGIDVNNLDHAAAPDVAAAAQEVAKESEVEKQVDEARKKLKKVRKTAEKSVTSQTSEAPIGGLFAGLEETQSTENGNQRTNELRSEGLQADDNRPGRDNRTGTREAGQGAEQESGGPDRSGEGRSSANGRPVSARPGRSVRKNLNNNRGERGVSYAPTAPAARFKANIAAIKKMRELVDSGKAASKEDMEILRQFSGWGGLGTYFNDGSYSSILHDAMTDDEIAAAELSINSSYYTPVEVIDALWDAAKTLGFEGGRILEGSAGIGNILAYMPKAVSEASDISAVEIDPVTGNILKLLYPDADVRISGFEDVKIPNNSVDLAITNVPFVTGLHVTDEVEKDLSRKFGNIHDFCIAKNVRKLREGGIGIFITSSGTLDKSRTLRQWIVNEGGADFVSAFRLNNQTFGGTPVTSDIIIIRKRVDGKALPLPDMIGTTVTRRDVYRERGKFNRKTGEFDETETPVSIEYNTFFVEHPENMAGEMLFNFDKGEHYRATSVGLFPVDGKDQKKMLDRWVKGLKNLKDMFGQAQDVRDMAEKAKGQAGEDVSSGVKEGQLVVNSKGEVCINSLGKAVPLGVNSNKVKGHTKEQVLKDYNALKAAIDAVLEYQTNNESDEGLAPLLKALNASYDDFKRKYGPLNKNTAISFLRSDVDFPSVSAIEDYSETLDQHGKRIIETEKTDVFKRRMVGYKAVPSPKDAKDGVIVSMNQFGRIDLPYIAKAIGQDEDSVRSEILQSGLAFEDPVSGGLTVSYEYLSGNVREKLAYAKSHNEDGRYDENIKALERVIPLDIPAHLIEFSLGSDWLEQKVYADFAREKYGLGGDFEFRSIGGMWQLVKHTYDVNEYNESNRSAGVRGKLVEKMVMGSELMVHAMNNTRPEFRESHKDRFTGETTTTVDKEAEQAAQTRIDEIKDEFREWAKGKMKEDEELSQRVTRTYNDLFNAIVPKSVDERFVPEHFEGANTALKLYPHQSKAVIRGTTEPLMLAHEVGSGKTFTLITTAMEMRRLGTAKKPMIVVQNSTVGQFVSQAKFLYPRAKILTVSESDRTLEGRSAFYAKIKYNDWDMIVVPQSVFNMIPDSEERKRAFIQSRIDEKMYVLEQAKMAGADSQSIKRMERELKDLEQNLEEGDIVGGKKKRNAKNEAKVKANVAAKAKRQLDRKVDAVEDFDQMEIDALLIDEAHEYKHLGFATSLQQGIKGVDPSVSQKAASVFLKTRSVFDRAGWKNVVFATGTPISNTTAEIWTFMRYLMPDDAMQANHIYYFDDFVRNFGNIAKSLEFATNGKFKENTRFSAYVNLPELVRIWASVTDTVLAKDAQASKGTKLKDKVPEMEGGKAQDIYLGQTHSLVLIMRKVRSILEEFEKMSGKEKRRNSHIPLTAYGIAKRAAIDPRLVLDNAPDEPNSKTNKAVEVIADDLEATKDYNGTVVVFCDRFRRKGEDGSEAFNIFDDMKKKLVAKGVPAEQIAIIRSEMRSDQKERVFAKVNSGEIRVVMGSTQLLGTGVNIQERLHMAIHMDAPDRPMDYTQRNGRILRQGNVHKNWGKTVRVVRFGVEDSLDVTAYQRLKTKAAFIDSVMDGKPLLANSMENRTLEEEEEGLFDNPVAVLSGSQFALLKSQAERELKKLRNKLEMHRSDQIYINDQLKKNARTIEQYEGHIERFKKNIEAAKRLFPDGTVKKVTIGGMTATTEEEINKAIAEKVSKPLRDKIDAWRDSWQFEDGREAYVFEFDGVKVNVVAHVSKKTEFRNNRMTTMMSTYISFDCPELGVDVPSLPGGVNAVKDVVPMFRKDYATGKHAQDRIEDLQNRIDRMNDDNEKMQERRGKPFPDQDKLEEAQKRVDEYTEAMKKELAEKEAKYSSVEAGSEESDIQIDLTTEDEDSDQPGETSEGGTRFSRSDYDRASAIAAFTGESEDDILDEIEQAYVEDEEFLLSDTHFSRGFDREDGEREIAFLQRVMRDLHKRGYKQIAHELAMEEGEDKKDAGDYDPVDDLIRIFAKSWKDYGDYENTFFHENLHAFLAHNGIDSNSPAVQDLLGYLRKEKPELMKKWEDELGYDDKSYKPEEEFVVIVTEAMSRGDAEKMLPKVPETARKTIEDYFNAIGYDYQREARERHRLSGEPDRGSDGQAEGVRLVSPEAGENNEEGQGITVFSRAPQTGDLKDRYEARLNDTLNKIQESHQDSMLALKILQEEIAKETGRPLESFEDAYMAENQLSSVNSAEKEFYARNYFRPMIEAVGELMDASGLSYGDIIKYAIAKHGLERNEVFHDRDEQEAGKVIDRKDYSGLTALMLLDGEDAIDLDEAEERARQFVDDVEAKAAPECAKLWTKVKDATKKALYKSWQSGIMTRSEYERVRDMFHFYVPLRGFDEETAEQHYEYLDHKTSPFSPAMRTAKGRTSIADDPFATIGTMWESTVQQGNNNLVKQKFLNMVLNRPNELVTVRPMWYIYDPATDEWSQAAPRITAGMTQEQIQQEFEDFQERMDSLQMLGLASQKKPKRGMVNIPYRLLGKQDQEHLVVVKSGGKDWVLVVNGNPRAAQAINGLTNPDRQDFLAKMARANRWMAANFTTRSPKFVLRNLIRDTTYSLFSIDIKEDTDYNRAFRGNLMRNYGRIWGLMKRFKAGEFDGVDDADLNEAERLFREFMMNGGETGYTQLKRVDEYKKMVNRIIGSNTGEKLHEVKNAWRAVEDMVGFANRCVEDICRLSAFMTSRQIGRDIQTSVANAKEISVNFNKKGSGDGYGSSFARAAYLFYNAGVQGLQNFMTLRSKSRGHWTGLKRFDVRIAETLALGAMIPFLNSIISAAVGGDDDEYADLPDWIRRNNLVLGGGGFYVTVPLSIELRAIYGIGDIAYMTMAGRMKDHTPAQIGLDVIGQVADIMPLNPVEGVVTNKGKNIGEGLLLSLVPDVAAPIAQAALNTDFTGRPIYKKQSWNENAPAWTKAYAGTSKVLVRSAEFLSDVTGGDQYGPGTIDVNPAVVEHLLEGYFGGLLTFAKESAKTVEMAWDDDYRQLRNVPLANVLLQKNDERSASSYVNDMYYHYKEEAELTSKRARGYRSEGDIERAARIASSSAFTRAQYFKQADKQIKDLQDRLKETEDKSMQDELRKRIAELKREMVERLTEMD